MFNVRPTKEWPWLDAGRQGNRLECLRRPLSLPKSARRRIRIFVPSFSTRSCSRGETSDLTEEHTHGL
jgi:hypothetical protein